MSDSWGKNRLVRITGLGAAALVAAFALSARADDSEPKAQPAPGTTAEKYDPTLFGPDPSYADKPYQPQAQEDIYGGKRAEWNPLPIILGQKQYEEGPLNDTFTTFFGEKNPGRLALEASGDVRTGIAAFTVGKKNTEIWGNRVDLDVDFNMTSTERLNGFFRPIDHRKDATFDGCTFGGTADKVCNREVNLNPESLFFEGDAASLYAGWSGEYLDRDLPFSVGLMPLFLQNGVWADVEGMIGGAATMPHMNSAALGISNMDVTVFTGLARVTTKAIVNADGTTNDDPGQVYGVTAFIETLEGYIETGYGYTHDRFDSSLDYSNVAFAFSRRYWATLTNTVRLFGDFGQNPHNANGTTAPHTADGGAIIVENSFITQRPDTLVPYLNGFIGFDRPQSLVRDNDNIMKNTGIAFETDGLTGFPELDNSGESTFGGAAGVEYLFNLDQQLIVEASTVQRYGSALQAGRPLKSDQYGFAVRYQIPITNDVILRVDGIQGIQADNQNIEGVRFEIRLKF